MVLVDGQDAGLELIKEGFAWVYSKYLPEASVEIQQSYAAAEAAARAVSGVTTLLTSGIAIWFPLISLIRRRVCRNRISSVRPGLKRQRQNGHFTHTFQKLFLYGACYFGTVAFLVFSDADKHI